MSPVVVLDDDPTGAQLTEQARVLLTWTPERIAAAADAGARTIHLVTNSRALDPAAAYAITLGGARAARTALPDAAIITRGDSTLRGHVGAEYEALRDGALAGRDCPLLLAMALPSAGRFTRDGLHVLEHDGTTVALHETEYARDPAFGYPDARLLIWAERASGGLLPAAAGAEIHLRELRSEGAQGVARTLDGLVGTAPAACAVDSESLDDLRIAAEGFAAARLAETPVAVRCAPAFAALLGGNLAAEWLPVPSVGSGGVLVVCGSYMAGTTRQLEALAAGWPGCIVEADMAKLRSSRAADERRRLAEALAGRLDRHGVAVLATARQLDGRIQSQEDREGLARSLAEVVPLVEPAPGLIIAKGGITSAATLQYGVGADEADVLGPVAPGVSLWSPARPQAPPYLVVPGNVGHPGLLLELVTAARAPRGVPA